MDDSEILTEAQAAALIGYSAANLRSHRLRYEAGQIAAALTPEQAAVLTRVRRHGSATEPKLDDYRGPALFRRKGDAWGLTQQGLEVCRRIGTKMRRAPEPPPASVEPGQVRYRRSDVLDWLRRHPEISRADDLAAKTWGYEETAAAVGIAVGTLKTWVSRAQVAQRLMDAGEPDPDGKLAKAAGRAPPWVWAGAERRWVPRTVKAWAKRNRRQPGDDPLAVKPNRKRGPLLTEIEARALMGVTAETLVGYRARARAALRRIAGQKEPSRRDLQRARSHPPYVVKAGARLYHEADVREWVEQRGSRLA